MPHIRCGPDGDDRVGVVLGTFTAGGQPTSEYLAALHAGGAAGAPALLFNSTVGNAPASLAGLEYKLRGPNITVSVKEASSLAAVVTATDLLRHGRAAALVSGGVDALFDIFFRVHDRFDVMAPMPSAATPFSAQHNGFLFGEGGYALLLEDDAGVAERSGRRYGEILGVGAASAAVGINRWPDRAEPLVRSMHAALTDAGLSPRDIGVVYAGANGAAALDDHRGPRAPRSVPGQRSGCDFNQRNDRRERRHGCRRVHCRRSLRRRAGGSPDLWNRQRRARSRRVEHCQDTLPTAQSVRVDQQRQLGGALFSVVLRVQQ